MAEFQGKRRSPRRVRWDCQVPFDNCTGSGATTNMPQGYRFRAHGTMDEANRCQRRYVKFRNANDPPGSGILTMSKPVALKAGKANVVLPAKFRG